jgi:hypothetical protein
MNNTRQPFCAAQTSAAFQGFLHSEGPCITPHRVDSVVSLLTAPPLRLPPFALAVAPLRLPPFALAVKGARRQRSQPPETVWQQGWRQQDRSLPS